MQKDQEFLEYVIKALVDHPEQVKVNEPVGGLKSPERIGVTVPLSTPNSKTIDEAMADLKLE